MTKEQIISQAMRLTPEDRAEMVNTIWESLHADGDPLTDEQAAELDRRMEAHRENPEESHTWEQIKASLLRGE